MIERALEAIGPEDLRQPQANRVPESQTLEYKQLLPRGTDGDRKEFLGDVSSFANAIGGDLVYGVTEVREDGKATGIPETVDGLADVNPDAEGLRLESMLRDGIAPRLSNVRLRWVPGFSEGPVLIIRVARSWSGPHMVTYQQHSRFYARAGSSKYALDVFQLRQAFLNSGSLSERAREFRAERLGRLLAGEMPVTLSSTSLVCVHVIPHAAFAGVIEVDFALAASQGELLQPFYSQGRGSTYNLDGFLTFSPKSDGTNSAYLQVHRNGVLETVNSTIMTLPLHPGEVQHLPALPFATVLIEFVERARSVMRAIGIEPPMSVFVSLLGVRGLELGVSLYLFAGNPTPFDRDNVLLRDVLLTDWEGNVHSILKPLLDQLWQAAGHGRCLLYDAQGNWRP
jgi:hypothetical protein